MPFPTLLTLEERVTRAKTQLLQAEKNSQKWQKRVLKLMKKLSRLERRQRMTETIIRHSS